MTEKPNFYRVVYEGKEKPKQFQVICNLHGLLGVVFKASEGLGLFEARRQRTEGCMEASIKPIKEVSWLQRKSMRRIPKSGKK